MIKVNGYSVYPLFLTFDTLDENVKKNCMKTISDMII